MRASVFPLPQFPTGRPSPERLRGIEFIRFGAAFAVLIAHYSHFYFQGTQAVGLVVTEEPWFALLHPLYRYGTRAVEVFWAVSGFIFLHHYGRALSAGTVGVGRFFWLRFSRLYPLHLLTLLVVAGLQGVYHARNGDFYVFASNDLRHFVLNLLFASEWGLQRGFSFNGPVWSVSLELLVYALFFVTARLFGTGLVTTGSVLAGCVLINRWLGYEAMVVRCGFYFYVGGLSCLLYRWLLNQPAPGRLAGALAAVAAVVGCVLRFRVGGSLDLWLLNLACPLALVVAGLVSPLISGRLAVVADGLGNLTYASYLCHFPVQLMTVLVLGWCGVAVPVGQPWFLVAYLALVLGLARFVYLRVELPAQDLIRRRFAPSVGGRAGPAPALLK